MKNKLVSLILLAAGISLAGCLSATQKAAIVSVVENPNNIAAGTEKVAQSAATAVLANNPTYAPDFAAAADALLAVADSNPTDLVPSDIAGALAKTSISAAIQKSANAVISSALGSYKTSWNASLPTVSPNWSLFLKAFANGLNEAMGKAGVPLPVVPWPPVAAPAVAPAS
jgi:hypothetical protein